MGFVNGVKVGGLVASIQGTQTNGAQTVFNLSVSLPPNQTSTSGVVEAYHTVTLLSSDNVSVGVCGSDQQDQQHACNRCSQGSFLYVIDKCHENKLDAGSACEVCPEGQLTRAKDGMGWVGRIGRMVWMGFGWMDGLDGWIGWIGLRLD